MKDIGGYKVIEKIGEGGMAVVYKGLQVSLQRPVAIKVLSTKLTRNQQVRERFDRESLIIARLNHPHIIHVIDRGLTDGGMPYFIMEYVRGNDLRQLINRGTVEGTLEGTFEDALDGDFGLNRKIDLVIQICKALSYAHRNGVIHRDVKPENILIDREGNVRVLDFGIAQLFYKDNWTAQQTQPDMIMGTIAYMSPEQQDDPSRVSYASDLFSLGAVMYELFTGKRPYGRFKAPTEINPAIPKPLEEAIHRCLEPNPLERFASADELKDNLLKILQGAHLGDAQRERAARGIAATQEKFALLDVIKEDRYGAVYLYENKVDSKPLVIKKRLRSTAGLTEAKRLTALNHKNIVKILGASGNETLFIVVMEYLSGGSLKDRLIRPLPWQEVLLTAREICGGLSFAHKNRILHGNLRPSNILFTDAGVVKVSDFGLDEHYSTEMAEDNWYNTSRQPRSPQTDILAAGTVFYQMLTSTLPEWQEDGFRSHEAFRAIPTELQRMVSNMLLRDPDSRYGSFAQVLADLDDIMTVHDVGPGRASRYAGSEEAAKPTVVMESRKPDAEREVLRPPSMEDEGGSKAKFLRRTFLLLLLLAALAAGYMQVAGLLSSYTEPIIELWREVTS